MPEPPCECPGPGWCPRYQAPTTKHTHHLCQTRESTRAKCRLRLERGDVQPVPVTPPDPPPIPLPVITCVFEGPVLEECTSCNAVRRELNHIRACDHPGNDEGRCTRGPNSGAVWSCTTCCPPHSATA